jgi:hypothetical protein
MTASDSRLVAAAITHLSTARYRHSLLLLLVCRTCCLCSLFAFVPSSLSPRSLIFSLRCHLLPPIVLHLLIFTHLDLPGLVYDDSGAMSIKYLKGFSTTHLELAILVYVIRIIVFFLTSVFF